MARDTPDCPRPGAPLISCHMGSQGKHTVKPKKVQTCAQRVPGTARRRDIKIRIFIWARRGRVHCASTANTDAMDIVQLRSAAAADSSHRPPGLGALRTANVHSTPTCEMPPPRGRSCAISARAPRRPHRRHAQHSTGPERRTAQDRFQNTIAAASSRVCTGGDRIALAANRARQPPPPPPGQQPAADIQRQRDCMDSPRS